jgi:hypothetical protein
VPRQRNDAWPAISVSARTIHEALGYRASRMFRDDAAVRTHGARAMPKRSPILISTVGAAVVVLSICKAPARDLGQWEGVDPAQREWFDGLMQPDNPNRRCCGLADAYWADSYEVKDNQYIAIITDERDDKPLGRPHIENGRRFVVPNSKIKWDSGNPTGHGIIFIGHGLEIHCYLPPGGG